jgi:intracellular multiplication protein IcmB
VRNRLYDRVGFSEGLRRLAKVFPGGSALTEIERRKAERLTRGELDTKAELGVIDELAGELINGTGMGMTLRDLHANEDRPILVAAE